MKKCVIPALILLLAPSARGETGNPANEPTQEATPEVRDSSSRGEIEMRTSEVQPAPLPSSTTANPAVVQANFAEVKPKPETPRTLPAVPDKPPPQPNVAGPAQILGENVTLKLGFLLQPQYELVGSPTLNNVSNNLFVRRTRILVGATLFKHFDFFLETDYPNLFKAPNAAPGEANNKATPGMNVQDAYATAKAADELKFDVGYMLPATSHNALQSAATLYSWDYFTNSFRHSNVFGSSADPVGRDAGIQMRGLLLKGIFEYRVGLFQGKRDTANATDVASRNFFRTAARLQINLLDPETGFFYGGTYLGAKRVLSFGVSYDWQGEYHHSSGDGILDIPVGPGVLTAQVDVSHWNGGAWVPLPRQTALMGEAGYLIKAIHLSPIVRFERRWVDHESATLPDETRWGGGIAFWPYGHNVNVKAFFVRVNPTPSKHDYNQAVVQTQVFMF